MREAEAKAARVIIKRETANFPSQKYVMLGDFNDKPDSESVQILTRKDSDGWGLVDAFREEPDTVSYPTSERTARKWGYTVKGIAAGEPMHEKVPYLLDHMAADAAALIAAIERHAADPEFSLASLAALAGLSERQAWSRPFRARDRRS